jgi:hypothetical protein
MIRDGFESLLQGRDPILVGEVMNSYLGSKDRVDFAQTKSSAEAGSQRGPQAAA